MTVHVTCADLTDADRQAGRDRERERGEIGLAGMSQKVRFNYQPQPREWGKKKNKTKNELFFFTRPPGSSTGATSLNFNSHLKKLGCICNLIGRTLEP